MFNNPYYWLSGTLKLLDEDISKDEFAVRQNYVAITPLSCDLTAHGFIGALEQWNMQK